MRYQATARQRPHTLPPTFQGSVWRVSDQRRAVAWNCGHSHETAKDAEACAMDYIDSLGRIS